MKKVSSTRTREICVLLLSTMFGVGSQVPWFLDAFYFLLWMEYSEPWTHLLLPSPGFHSSSYTASHLDSTRSLFVAPLYPGLDGRRGIVKWRQCVHHPFLKSLAKGFSCRCLHLAYKTTLPSSSLFFPSSSPLPLSLPPFLPSPYLHFHPGNKFRSSGVWITVDE